MIALLSALVGFLSSAAPEFLKLFEDGQDRAHELAVLQLQMQYDEKKLGAEKEVADADRALRLQEIEISADSAETQSLNDRPGSGANKTGISWVDALAGSVRPILTYAFFALYFAVKCCQFHLLVTPGLPWMTPVTGAQALVTLWTQEDIAVFSAVIGFWFGNRTLQKMREAKAVMHTSATGMALIRHFEGFSATPYRCPARVPDHRLRPCDGRRVAAKRSMNAAAEHLLKADLVLVGSAIARLITRPLAQCQFDALASFTYNLGSGALQRSTLRRLLNRNDDAHASAQFARWVYAGSRKLPGLVRRRNAEAKVFQGMTIA